MTRMIFKTFNNQQISDHTLALKILYNWASVYWLNANTKFDQWHWFPFYFSPLLSVLWIGNHFTSLKFLFQTFHFLNHNLLPFQLYLCFFSIVIWFHHDLLVIDSINLLTLSASETSTDFCCKGKQRNGVTASWFILFCFNRILECIWNWCEW